MKTVMPIKFLKSMPIIVSVNILGAISLGADKPEDYKPDDRNTLEQTRASHLDPLIESMQSKVAESPKLLQRVALNLAFTSPLAEYRFSPDGKLLPTLMNSYRTAADKAISGTKRYGDKLPEPVVRQIVLTKSKIILLMFEYPPAALSATEERASLRVNFWICSDRITALIMAWSADGINGDLSGNVEPPATEPFRLPAQKLDIGERGWEWEFLDPGQAGYASALEPVYNRVRLGLIRNNIIIEVNTFTQFQLPANPGKWFTRGMTGIDQQESMDILKSLDGWVLNSSKPQAATQK